MRYLVFRITQTRHLAAPSGFELPIGTPDDN